MIWDIIVGAVVLLVGLVLAVAIIYLGIVIVWGSISEHRSNKNMPHDLKEKWGKNGCG